MKLLSSVLGVISKGLPVKDLSLILETISALTVIPTLTSRVSLDTRTPKTPTAIGAVLASHQPFGVSYTVAEFHAKMSLPLHDES